MRHVFAVFGGPFPLSCFSLAAMRGFVLLECRVLLRCCFEECVRAIVAILHRRVSFRRHNGSGKALRAKRYAV